MMHKMSGFFNCLVFVDVLGDKMLKAKITLFNKTKLVKTLLETQLSSEAETKIVIFRENSHL